jgi:hypothetical protein
MCFDIDLSRLEPAEIEFAAERVERAQDKPGVMPPPEARQLTAAARDRLLNHFRADAHRREPVPELVRASDGMGPTTN